MTSKLKKIEVIYGGYKVKKGIYEGLAFFILLILTASLSGLIHTYKLDRNSTTANVNKETQAASIDKIHDIEGIKKSKEMPYMIYYGKLDKKTIDMAKTYRLVIINPMTGNVTRSQVKEIQQGLNPDNPSDDVIVLGHISIGEDLRTGNLTDEQMLQDKRFTGDGTGPRVDPRGPIPKSDKSLEGIEVLGKASPGGDGYACWYLDDNNYDGKPDRNGIFKCAFVNAGDPAWFDIVNKMTMDGAEGLPQSMLKETLMGQSKAVLFYNKSFL